MSSSTIGQSGIGFIVMYTVAVSWQTESETIYFSESSVVSELSWIYSILPSSLIVAIPYSGSI